MRTTDHFIHVKNHCNFPAFHASFFLSVASLARCVAQTDLTATGCFAPNGDGIFREVYYPDNQSGRTISGTPLGGGEWNSITARSRRPVAPCHCASGCAGNERLPPRIFSRSQVYDALYQDGRLSLQTQNYRKETMQGIAERTTRRPRCRGATSLPLCGSAGTTAWCALPHGVE